MYENNQKITKKNEAIWFAIEMVESKSSKAQRNKSHIQDPIVRPHLLHELDRFKKYSFGKENTNSWIEK